MMALDEAIKHFEKIRNSKSIEGLEARLQEQDKYADECFKCASEHDQLAEWLKLLKSILDSGDCNNCAIQKMCNVRPEWGGQVRYNCPMFVRGEQEEDKK